MGDKKVTCRKCKVEKDISEYKVINKNKSGYDSQCKECARAYSREYARTYNKKKNRYPTESLEHIIFDYFKRMEVYPDVKEMKYIVDILISTKSFWKSFARIENRLRAKKENYESDFLSELRDDRRLSELTSQARSTKTRRVRQLTLEGDYVATYDSITLASIAVTGCYKKAVGSICQTASGRNRQSCGFIWEYVRSWEEK